MSSSALNDAVPAAAGDDETLLVDDDLVLPENLVDVDAFDGDNPMQLRIKSPIYRSHAAVAYDPFDAIMRKFVWRKPFFGWRLQLMLVYRKVLTTLMPKFIGGSDRR